MNVLFKIWSDTIHCTLHLIVTQGFIELKWLSICEINVKKNGLKMSFEIWVSIQGHDSMVKTVRIHEKILSLEILLIHIKVLARLKFSKIRQTISCRSVSQFQKHWYSWKVLSQGILWWYTKVLEFLATLNSVTNTLNYNVKVTR